MFNITFLKIKEKKKRFRKGNAILSNTLLINKDCSKLKKTKTVDISSINLVVKFPQITRGEQSLASTSFVDPWISRKRKDISIT